MKRKKMRFMKGLIIVKLTIMIALIATYFLPQDHAWIVGFVANLLWLWRT